jgi:MFS superfamily sulfate permease-like transporter
MPSAVKWVVVDAEAMTHMDYTAARILVRLKKNLDQAGVELAFARVPWDLKSDFNRHHVTEVIGPERFFNRLHDAIAAFEGSAKLPGQDGG